MKDLTRFFTDLPGEVSALRSASIEPQIKDTSGEALSRTEQRIWRYQVGADKQTAAMEISRMQRIRDAVFALENGSAHWFVLGAIYGPLQRAVRPRGSFEETVDRYPYGEFKERAPIARFTTIARARGAALWLDKHRRAELHRVVERGRPRPLDKVHHVRECHRSPMGVAMRVLDLDARLPLEPSPRELEYWAARAIEEACAGKHKDHEFLTEAKREARDMHLDAGDAYRRAKAAVEKSIEDEKKAAVRAFVGAA